MQVSKTRDNRPNTAPKKLVLLGVSFRTAPVAVRESLSFNNEDAESFIKDFTSKHPGTELFILSTCNRTEFYLASENSKHATQGLIKTLKAFRPQASIFHSDCHLFPKKDADAATHLFRVSCGLDSAILGDGQILGQVKDAMKRATRVNSLGPCLNRVLYHTLRVAKCARRTTNIGQGNAGLGSAIAALVSEREERSQLPTTSSKILIIGAGEIAREIGRNLAKETERKLVFINRNRERAEFLAAHCGGRATNWESIPHEISQSDFIIAATATKEPIITNQSLLQTSGKKSPLFIDAGVPRNIADITDHEVLNVDTIRTIQEKTLSSRKAAAPIVESLIQAETQKWVTLNNTQPLEGMIKALFKDAQSASELLSQSICSETPLDTNSTKRLLKQTLESIIGQHARQLRQWAINELPDTESSPN